MADSTPIVSPLFDFGVIINVQLRDDASGVLSPCTTGATDGFLATGNAADAVAIDATFISTGIYVGANGGDLIPGDWFFPIDAAVFTVAKCRAAFVAIDGTVSPVYFIARRVSGYRGSVKCKYVDARKIGT